MSVLSDKIDETVERIGTCEAGGEDPRHLLFELRGFIDGLRAAEGPRGTIDPVVCPASDNSREYEAPDGSMWAIVDISPPMVDGQRLFAHMIAGNRIAAPILSVDFGGIVKAIDSQVRRRSSDE